MNPEPDGTAALRRIAADLQRLRKEAIAVGERVLPYLIENAATEAQQALDRRERAGREGVAPRHKSGL